MIINLNRLRAFQQTVCVASPTEKHTNANAASDPNCNEANSTSGWAITGSATIGVSSTEFTEGIYSIELTSSGAASDEFAHFSFSGVASTSYTVTWWAKVNTVHDQEVKNWGNGAGTPVFTPSTSWTQYTHVFTATATASTQLRFYVNDGATPAGGKFFIDGLSITET